MGTPVSLANAYTAVCEYSVVADPTIKWRNTYDFHSTVVPTGTADIVAALLTYAPGLVYSVNQLETVKVYNWSKGTNPYPAGLPILELSPHTAGTASSMWVTADNPGAADNGVCLRIDKLHAGIGRPGRFFVRNLLPPSALGAQDGGRWTIQPGSHYQQSQLEAWITSSGVVNYLAGHVDPTTQQAFITVQYSHKANIVHGYNYDSNWVIVGATTNKPTRKSKK